MKLSLQQIAISLAALLIAIATVIWFSRNPMQLGSQPLVLRALALNVAVLAALIAVHPLNPLFKGRPGAYAAVVCVPALIPAFVYFLFILPGRAGAGFSAEQLQSSLITDSSSNGIIEVGFSYPIYTPTLAITNLELFSRKVNVFLRMTDGDGQQSLFRGVRAQVPGASLSVEATVLGMLSENGRYIFNPVALPPGRPISGQVVFIISNLEDGSTFTEALGRAYQGQFELRDPETGQLLFEFPMDRL
jgi:hypothetical protein